MKKLTIVTLIGLMLSAGAAAAQECGASTGKPATGKPIKVGGIYANAAAGDFSSSTQATAAYFKCVNANGGIHGRPIEYIVDNDQFNPELAAQIASKLLDDKGVVALVGSGSFVEMAVNAKTYVDRGVMVMAAACAVAECFETPNIVSTNEGPLASNLGAVQYAVERLGTKSVACLAFPIPNVGPWTCDQVAALMKARGGVSHTVFVNPASPDLNSALLEAIATGADTMLVNFTASLAVPFLKLAQEQDLRDSYVWIAPTPLYDLAVPAAVGKYWDGAIYVNAELAPFSKGGPDAQNWKAVMDAYGAADQRRDTFSQSGYLAGRFFVKTLLAMNPADVDNRAKVTTAIKGINGYRSDLMCGPYYVGEADFHMPNHAGYMLRMINGGFEVVRDCYEYDSPYFDRHKALEKKLGLR